MGFHIGVDVGGTFTDFLLHDEAAGATAFKVLSTPDDPARAVFAGLTEMAAAQDLPLDDFLAGVELIVHGTTVTTNAVLTGQVARTGLLTTRGFRDALQMRRGIREKLYDNKYTAPRPIVPRRRRLPVAERVDLDGNVIQPLAEDEVAAAIEELRGQDIEAVAICFMHSYANPAHEARAAEMVAAALPEAYLSVSAQILPQVRFYERTSTTVLNAAVGPVLKRYLDSLVAKLDGSGFAGVLLIMQSNGGVTAPGTVSQLAASTLLSGPAAAPVAGLAYAALHGARDIITVDMGGTSFDAALVKDQVPQVTSAGSVDRLALALPTMEINTIGAGGGSIGCIDEGGLLRMGPESAGADPGPACYGRGGQRPTCTDANLVLGYLAAGFFAGGRIALDGAAAEAAIAEHIAKPLDLDVVAAAAGMVQVMNVNMASAMREISVQKGYDPREFLMICAGGAGPIHAAMIARELDIRRFLVPRDSSIFCAAGMLRSDLKHDFVRSLHGLLAPGGIDPDELSHSVAELQTEAQAVLADDGIPPERRRLDHAADLRYLGQYHEVTVELPADTLESCDVAAIAAAFHAAHDRLYGYHLADEETAIELVNLRLTAIGVTEKPPLETQPEAGPDPATALKGRRPVYLPETRDFAEVAVFDGEHLAHGMCIEGPAIVEQVNTTVFLPPGHDLTCDAGGSFMVTAP
ncbi:MAG: hydantoinase/oxoprolinase family protein [Alphaproteobacteria bacterium]|nr:hydantoinase/oxoprolinase family protein [Alphaproteobacteria bacterium]HJP23448.1 hydantoinase/oxoprolinase family protein [Alphaproteobacteria bacterium]